MAFDPAARRRTADAPALRRRMLVIAWVVLGLAAVHFVDHVIRGYYVIDHGLDPTWNHSGWPFLPAVTPFTGSLIGVSGLLGIGIWLTAHERAWARYWLITAALLETLVLWVHFVGPRAETPAVIYNSWANPVLGTLAVGNTLAVIVALLVMGTNAVLVGRASDWRPGPQQPTGCPGAPT